MKAQRRGTIRRPNMRKAVFLFPSGLTLLNLFFGVFAIIAAARLEFTTAGVYVVIGGICDALDGRVARATNAGSQFGEELDSLVDAITFGLAPGMIMYFAVLNRGGWDWVWVFAFVACAVLRLARFNIEQAGTAKTYFQGLPSPAAGITLASYYWFSQSGLYDATQTWLTQYSVVARLPWHHGLRLLIAVLAALMTSNVPYPTLPRTGFRSLRAIGASIVVFGAFALLLTGRLQYFFPIALVYILVGLLRWLFSGLFERRQPTVPYDLSEGEDDEDDEFEVVAPIVQTVRIPQREEVSTGGTRTRGRNERGDRPPRPDRESRSPRADSPARAERADKAAPSERPAKPDKADRPQRTEAERAARREKRDKREGRAERAAPARVERPEEVQAAATLTPADDVTVSEPSLPDEVIGRIPGAAEGGATVTPLGTTSGRKRKRRRRRGERKDRPGNAPGDGAGGEANDADGGSDESGPDEESRSPYASATDERSEREAPAQQPAPPSPPSSPPSNPSLFEPHE